MSMTQEEIEALMNNTMIDSVESSDNNSIDDLLAGIDGIVDDGHSSTNYAQNIDDFQDNIDTINKNNHLDLTDMDTLLANIDGITENPPIQTSISSTKESSLKQDDNDSMGIKIDKGIYPMPVEKEHKVVNQLSEVAEDSEAKASQIFDVLSFILDENDLLQKNTVQVLHFVDMQIKLLETLCEKFPNIEIFNENLQKANSSKALISQITIGIEDENNKVFEAMELMQYHDINRQKIERVMAVIRKLSLYLSGLFEDTSNKPEVQIAKHISGDSSETVSEDDLDNLIAEFNKEV